MLRATMKESLRVVVLLAALAVAGCSSPPMPITDKAIDAALQMGIANESYVERLKKRREEVTAAQAAQEQHNVR